MSQLPDRFRALLSFHYYRTADLTPLTSIRVLGEPPDLFADSGAFSAHTQGAAVELDDYCRWLERWEGCFTVCANLDVIGDVEAGLRNLEVMEARGFRPLPVFHTGDPWDVLDDLCARYPYVALGGAVGWPTKLRMPWLIECFMRAAKYGTRFHGFGVTTWPIITSLPFATVDSSSWGSGHRFGVCVAWDPKRKVLVKFMVGTPEAAKHGRLIRSYGFDPLDVEDRERYSRERAIEMAAVAWAHAEGHLRQLHAKGLGEYLARANPPHTETTGPRVYLADGSMQNLVDAAHAVAAYHDRRTVPA